MNLNYEIYTSFPEECITREIEALHKVVFGTFDEVTKKMTKKHGLLVIVANDGHKIVGYKIGYEIDKYKFYSWLGGVDPMYRGKGIASALMDIQHKYIKNKGYKVVQTKSMNKWRGMLILNIKMGFNVINTYIDKNGTHKIILEKNPD